MKTTKELFFEGLVAAGEALVHMDRYDRGCQDCEQDHLELCLESVTTCVATWLDWVADQVGAPRHGEVLEIPLFRLPEG